MSDTEEFAILADNVKAIKSILSNKSEEFINKVFRNALSWNSHKIINIC